VEVKDGKVEEAQDGTTGNSNWKQKSCNGIK
jgi:hypothetical protein